MPVMMMMAQANWDSKGDAVATGLLTVLGEVVDNRGQQETDGDGQLVSANDGTADPAGSSLRLIQRDRLAGQEWALSFSLLQ